MFRAAAGILKNLVRSTRSLPHVRLFTSYTPFEDVSLFKEPQSLESFKQSGFNLTEHPRQALNLKALKTAKATPLSSTCEKGVRRVSAVTLPRSFANYAQPTTLYIRESFYRRYFNLLRKKSWSIVIGNPGVCKFQWYILYCLVNEKVVPTLGPNHLKSTEPPKVIARQVGDSSIFLYFPHCDKVYVANSQNQGLLRRLLSNLKPSSALYLFAPGRLCCEPFYLNIQTIISCSPDQRHYKEFEKRGALPRCMPCWTLDELQLVGAHVASRCDDQLKDFYSPEEIENRYNRFGGIIQYVIPANKSVVEQVQKSEMT